MSRIKRVAEEIRRAYPEADVKIIDDTPNHIGHREIVDIATPVEMHLIIKIVADEFEHMTPLEATKAVNRLIKQEFDTGLHAITLECIAPPTKPEQ
ncbi:BolA protein [Nematocida displodere]|uniref:BolA protein n=1 Tax=Nematocida displodere TaxID=1805483 RepID=A0A177EJY1_9MICR|nr:BolA protein [Nematocida displodere]